MIKRLRSRFIKIATLAVAGVLLLLCLIVNAANFVSVDSELTRTLTMISDNKGQFPRGSAKPEGMKEGLKDGLKDGLKEGLKNGDQQSEEGKPQGPGARGGMSPEAPYSTRYFVLRYDESGALTDSDLSHIAAVTEEDTDTYLAIARKHGTGFGHTAGYKYCVVRQEDGSYMAVFLDCYREENSMMVFAFISLGAMVLCVILVYGIVVLCSRRAIDPVVKASQRQKQFITDASHELKTPITVIATSLRVLEMEVGQQKWIDKAQAQTEKLKELVNSLVSLSRMDEEDSPLQMLSFPISEALRETAESFRDFARAKGHELELSIEPKLNYVGDEYAIRQLGSILLDNAVKYAPEGTPIRFSLEKSKKGVVLKTQNAWSAPMDQKELDRIFDRFYRPDQSRTSATGGFGIGLSIARSIAEGHKGSIRAAATEDGTGIEFMAELR